ncbi:MAG TPA: TetR family transcriptional regulator [Mycobacterium sp.]|nr:TetR family transcriptional regulator [Mycobacterium sp.]
MRVTRKQAEINRQRIIDSAVRLFAERGVDAVGVAEVMGAAGFTHGGFYNHFTSKDDLVLEACSTSFARSLDSLRDGGRRGRPDEADLGTCMSAAMLCESSKGNPRLSSVYAKGVDELLDALSEHFGDRDTAMSALSCFVGARAISRAVEFADRELASQFTAASPVVPGQARVHASS